MLQLQQLTNEVGESGRGMTQKINLVTWFG